MSSVLRLSLPKKDIKLTPQLIQQKNLVELKIAYYEIQEIVLSRFKPTGNLRYDVNSLRKEDKAYKLKSNRTSGA
jgi:hypothetical protein